jgi:hypothetical protein
MAGKHNAPKEPSAPSSDNLVERRLARLTRKYGGDERAARLEMIGNIIDYMERARRNEAWPFRLAVGEAMLAWLWQPLIPWMIEIGPEFGVTPRPEDFTPPYPAFDGPARCRRRVGG